MMSSKTLNLLLQHWNGKPFEDEGSIDLPFHVEDFCREVDGLIGRQREWISVDWHDINSDDKYELLPEYTDVWFVVGDEVHKGCGNGKFFYSEDEGYSYGDNYVSHFAIRQPDPRPLPPKPEA